MMARICRWRDMVSWLPGDSGLPAFLGEAGAVPLGDFLRRVSRPLDRAAKPLDSLNVVQKISFGGKLHIRSAEAKRNYKGPLFEALPGDLVFSKIRVAQGSVCVVPDTVDHLAVSPEYPIYRVDRSQVRPQLLSLVLRAPQFQRLLCSFASGNTTKRRLRPSDFEAIEVSLPDPELQDELLEAYEAALLKAAKLEEETAGIEERGVRGFEAALGLVPPPDLPRRPLQVAWFSDMERWSHEGILQTLCRERSVSGEGLVALGDFVEVTHGCSASPSPRVTGLEVLKISAVTRGVFRASEKKFAFDRPEFRRRFDLRRGDVLMCRTNGTLAYVGMSALVEEDMPNLIFPDKTFRVRVHSPLLLPEFLWRLLQLPAMRAQIESCVRTAVGNYAIGAADIAELQIMLPPVPTQKRLIRDLVEARRVANAKRERARKLRGSAWADFLAAIFR